MITGTPFRIDRIRARRPKPGLMRQHLTAVRAAAEICGAEVVGAEPGSRTLAFMPGKLRGGDYRFAIGTAGSCTLVLQTVLPALWFADRESTLRVSGGTHNPFAPPADFLMRSWLPLARRMGAVTDIELLRHGLVPSGGGEILARVAPACPLQPLRLDARGKLSGAAATAIVAGVPMDVARRELERLRAAFPDMTQAVRELPAGEGPGNALMLELAYPDVTLLFAGFGEKGLPAQAVADRVAKAARVFLASTASVEEHLADQLLLPMALARGGGFVTPAASSHLRTNREVIEKFLDVEFEIAEVAGGVRVEARA